MSDTLIIGLLSLTGTLLGSLGGILTANRLTNYRIEELEKKVEKHNSIVERTNELGGHLLHQTVYKQYKRLVASIGLPEARFHDLRHSYAVLALKQGMTPRPCRRI